MALLAAFIWPSSAIADQEIFIGSYDVPVHGAPNLKFVMLNPDEGTIEYSRSGLYRRGDPARPLWTVDWWSPRVGLFAEGDDVYLVRFPIWNRGGPSPDEFALAFYKNGRLLREYHVGELNPTHFRRSVSHFMWNDGCELDTGTGMVTLDTLNNKRYRFDARTGEIVGVEDRASTHPADTYKFDPRPETEYEKACRWVWADPEIRAGLGAALGLAGILVLLVWRRRRAAAVRTEGAGRMRLSNSPILALLNRRLDGAAVGFAVVAAMTVAMVAAYAALSIIYLVRGEAGFLQGFEYEAELVISTVVLWLVLLPIHIVWAACTAKLTMWEKVFLIVSIIVFAPFGMPVFITMIYRRRAERNGERSCYAGLKGKQLDISQRLKAMGLRILRYIFVVMAIFFWTLPQVSWEFLMFPELQKLALGCLVAQIIVWLVLLRNWKWRIVLLAVVAAIAGWHIFQGYTAMRDDWAGTGNENSNLGEFLTKGDTTTMAYAVFEDFVKHHATDIGLVDVVKSHTIDIGPAFSAWFPEYTGEWQRDDGFRFGATLGQYLYQDFSLDTLRTDTTLAKIVEWNRIAKDNRDNGVVVDNLFMFHGERLAGLRLMQPSCPDMLLSIDGDYWYALYDPGKSRYWIVRGSGWSAESFRGPYILASSLRPGPDERHQ